MDKKPVSTDLAPKAIGPYSQAIRSGNFLFCSGQIPLDPKTGQIVGNSIVEQTKQVMQNVMGLLKSQGLTAHNIVKSTVFIKNMGDFSAFNETYQTFLEPPYPARSTVEVARLPKDVLVEVEIVAAL